MVAVIAIAIASIVAYIIIYFPRLLEIIKDYYRIFLGVSKLNGPPAIPILGNIYGFKWDTEEFTFQMEYLFRKYAYLNESGIMRLWLGPVPTVFLTRPKSIKAVLENTKLLWKPPEYDLLASIWGSGLITSSGPKWQERRRMLTPAFHFKMLQNYLHVFNQQAKILTENLEKFCDEDLVVDLLPYLRRFSLDTIAETAMGTTIDAQKGKNESFYLSVTRVFDLLFKNLRYPWLWVKPVWYALGYGYEFDRHVEVITTLFKKVIHERSVEFENFTIEPNFEETFKTEKKKLSFLDLMLTLKKDMKLSDSDLLEEVGTFMIAGYDTVSSSIGFVLFLLGHRQSIQDKVYEELCSIFGESNREITTEDIKEMIYLEQCMKESMRMYPTVVLIGRRITEDVQIGNIILPKGITVGISPFSVARDPQQWKNPEIYDPEHFAPENVAKRDPFAFIPFSAGPRNCLGQKFAIMEMKVAVANIIRKYRIISAISEEENRALPEVSLKPSRGFPVRLESRQKKN